MSNPMPEIPQPVQSVVTSGPGSDDQSRAQQSQVAHDAAGNEFELKDGNWVNSKTGEPYNPPAQATSTPANSPFTPTEFAHDAQGNTYAKDADGQFKDINTRQPYQAPPAGDYLSKTEDAIQNTITGVLSSAGDKYRQVTAQAQAVHDAALKEFKAGHYAKAVGIVAAAHAPDLVNNPVTGYVPQTLTQAYDYTKSIVKPSVTAVQQAISGDLKGALQSLEEAQGNAMSPDVGTHLVQANELLRQGDQSGALKHILHAAANTAMTVGGVFGAGEVASDTPLAGDAVKGKPFGDIVSPKPSHVFDPEVRKVVPISEVAARRGFRQAAGSSIQQAAQENLDAVGQEVRAARDAAQKTPISGVPSQGFIDKLKDISAEADTPSLKSIPSDEMKNVKSVTAEIVAKPSFTHEEFEGYNKQLNDKISDLKTTKTDKSARRLYIQTKQALQNEYYDQLAQANPQVSQALKSVNTDYAEMSKAINEGPAKNLFRAAAPEQIVKRIVNGTVTESQIDPILENAEAYDLAHPEAVNGAAGSTRDYLRKATLYNQLAKFGQRTEDGLLVRIDPVAMLHDLDINPVYSKVYADAYDSIRESLIDEAKSQARYARKVQRRHTVGKLASRTGIGLGIGIAALGGAQALGIPVVSTLWKLVSSGGERPNIQEPSDTSGRPSAQ